MKKIKEFDKQSLNALRSELNAVLAKFEKKSGVEITTGKMRYTPTTVTIGLEAKIVGAQSREAATLELFTKYKENDVLTIPQLGKVKLVGYKTANRKYPYIAQAVNGKQYKLSEKHISSAV